MFEKETLPLVEDLQRKNLLARDATLPTIKREMTRYLIKQQQKLTEDKENRGEVADKLTASQVQVLHQIVSVFYLLTEVSYSSALAFHHTSLQKLQSDSCRVSEIQQYEDMLKMCFQKFRGYLNKENPSEHLPVHPKIAEVRNNLYKWFFKQRSRDENAQAVLICSTKCRYLFMKLCKELIKPDDTYQEIRLKPISVVVDVSELKKSDVLSAYEKNNVLILGEQMIFDDFPWNVVGLLIEYEPQVNTPWKEICAKMMIKHLSFQAILPNVSVSLDETVPVSKLSNESSKVEEDKPSLVLIGSEKFTALGSLLHLMETRFEMLVVERDYNRFKEGFHPDLILDATTCIVLQNLADLHDQDGGAVKSLLSVLTVLRRKFTICYVILASTSRDDEQRYPLGGWAPLNIARLQASVKQLANCTENFQILVQLCFSVENFAETLSNLTDKVLDNKAEDGRKSRSWISHEMSKEERFLLHLPCVNSFVAQRLLSVTTLREICRMARDEMLSTCKALNIPTKIAQDLYDCLHMKLEAIGFSKSHFEYRSTPKNDLHGVGVKVCDENCVEISDDGQRYAPFLPHNLPQTEVHAAPTHFQSPEFVAMKHPYDAMRSGDVPKTEFFDQNPYPQYNESLLENNEQVERPFLSQYPLNSEVLENDNNNAGFVPPASDVDELMLNAQKKLKEFVRLNPDRLRSAKPFETPCIPTENTSKSLYTSHSPILPNRYSTAFEPQNIQCFWPEKDSLSRFATPQTPNASFTRNYDSYCKIDPSDKGDFEQPCCSFQPLKQPTSAWKPHYFEGNNDSFGMQQDNFTKTGVRNASANNSFLNREECMDIPWVESNLNHCHSNIAVQPFCDNLSRNCGNDVYVTGTSGSANIGIAQPFLQQPWQHGDTHTAGQRRFGFSQQDSYRSKMFVMTPYERKKALKYERIPGSKDGQTRLAFY